MPMLVYMMTMATKLIQMPLLPVTASSTRITPWAIHGCRPTSVVIQPASSATTASPPRHRRPEEETGAERVSAPPPPPQVPGRDADHRAAGADHRLEREVHDVGRRSLVDRDVVEPDDLAVERFPASSDPTLGISIPARTSPSTSTPPMTSGALSAVSVASSIAASFAGCSCARRMPATWPMNGWRTAATAANANGTVNPIRWRRSVRPRSIPTAYTPADRKPATAYVATNMCRNCGHSADLNIAASGSTSVTLPLASTLNPAGAFIQALTARMQNVPNRPDDMIGISVRRCTSGQPVPAVQVDADEHRLQEERDPFERERQADDVAVFR